MRSALGVCLRSKGRWQSRAIAGAVMAGLSVGALGLGAATSEATTSGAVQTVAPHPQIPRGALTLGAVPASTTITGSVALKPADAAGLDSYATSVNTPGSPDYHHFLSLPQFTATYAPSAATVQAVENDLRAGGLTVNSVSADDLVINFSGSAPAVSSTFHTGGFERLQLQGGRNAYENASSATLPSAIAADVQGVIGLNDLVVPQADPPAATKTGGEAGTAQATPPSGAASPCAAANQTAQADSGLTANAVAGAYGLDPLYQAGDFGNGQKVDILDLYGYNASDIQTYDSCYYGATEGAQVFSRLSSTNVDGGAQTDPGDGGTSETELDVDTLAAYAPQAQVDVYEAPATNSGFLDDIAAMTDDTASKVESISYGSCEEQLQADVPGYVQEENTLFEQAAVEGKTVFASTADSGSDTCSDESGTPTSPLLSASDPSTQPYVTAVGGTAITAATDPPAEEVWNDGAAGGAGGGGISDIWEETAWQAHSTVPGLNNSSVIGQAEQVNGSNFCQTGSSYHAACREVPDVSAQASPNTGGFVIYVDGEWTVYGGTSLSSPTWAAILADINSTPACVAGGGAGFVSPALYSIASNPTEYAASFNDITRGNNDNLGANDGLFAATTGYDMATGLGSPKVTGAGGANGLAYYLCQPAAATAPAVSSVSPSSLASASVNTGTSLTVNGSGFETSGTPDVSGVTIGTVSVPASSITVKSAGQIVIDPVPATLLQTGNDGQGSGAGTYPVSVTLSGGESSTPGPNSTVIVYSSSGGPTAVPRVDGTSPTAGVQSGGNPVTIYGSGFEESPVTSVTFGGIAASSYSVVNDNEIHAVTPAYSGTTVCGSSDTPATGTCQVAVQVTTKNGASATPAIPAEYSGSVTPNEEFAYGDYPAPDEFDYEPTPHISSLSYDNAQNLASTAGGTLLTINGTGFGSLGLDWVNIGSYTDDTNSDYTVTSVSSTQLTVALPAEAPSTSVTDLPVTVQTAGSPNQAPGATLVGTAPSNTVQVAYAPTAAIDGVSSSNAVLAGPTSGGTRVTLDGVGFTGATQIVMTDLDYGFQATQSTLNVASNTRLTFNTPAALTGAFVIQVCGDSGCSAPSNKTFTFYVPGSPKVTSVSPASGPSGTKVTITGVNLGYIQAVYFGAKQATTFANGPAFFEGGDTTTVTATAPANTSGKTVDVRVVTLQSKATQGGESPVNTKATFTYTK
jgi:hypothetical protein